MQSTGHASTHAESLVPIQGSAITYAMGNPFQFRVVLPKQLYRERVPSPASSDFEHPRCEKYPYSAYPNATASQHVSCMQIKTMEVPCVQILENFSASSPFLGLAFLQQPNQHPLSI